LSTTWPTKPHAFVVLGYNKQLWDDPQSIGLKPLSDMSDWEDLTPDITTTTFLQLTPQNNNGRQGSQYPIVSQAHKGKLSSSCLPGPHTPPIEKMRCGILSL
jgi:hypothetical protein